MHQQRLLDRRAHAEARVERLVGILVDDLHAPPQSPQRTRRAAPVTSWPSKRIEPRLGLDQAEHALRGRRLAAARLADEGEHLAAPEVERDALDRVDGLRRPSSQRSDEAPRHGVARDEILDLEQRPAAVRRSCADLVVATVVQVAGRGVAGAHRLQEGPDRRAGLEGAVATRLKWAADDSDGRAGAACREWTPPRRRRRGPGVAAKSRRVYGCRGRVVKRVSRSVSTISPAYMTAARRRPAPRPAGRA